MNCTITVKTLEGGNPRRGYHNHESTVTFDYGEEAQGSWVAEKEEEIIAVMLGAKNCMWFTYLVKPEPWEKGKIQERVAAYKIRHGYDSGD